MDTIGGHIIKKSGLASCLIVGAGLSGLLAARRLRNAGFHVTVLEKRARVGGRVASCTLAQPHGQQAVFDYGAQYFTARSGYFREMAEAWQEEGVVRQWSDGFATSDATAYRDGQPRYRGQPHMAAITQHLARGLDVKLDTEIRSARFKGQWALTTQMGNRLQADALILTAPVPQSVALLEAADVKLPADSGQALATIGYDPCLALLVMLDGPSRVPPPGGLWPGRTAISWMADNAQKGVSSVPCLTIHASPEFSRDYFDAPEDEIVRVLLGEARPWIGASVVARRLARWRYSIPLTVYQKPVLFCDKPGPLAFAGDAFAGPRVEGAVLSGLAAAEAILAAAGYD